MCMCIQIPALDLANRLSICAEVVPYFHFVSAKFVAVMSWGILMSRWQRCVGVHNEMGFLHKSAVEFTHECGC